MENTFLILLAHLVSDPGENNEKTTKTKQNRVVNGCSEAQRKTSLSNECLGNVEEFSGLFLSIM